jgi:hypothetical protein
MGAEASLGHEAEALITHEQWSAEQSRERHLTQGIDPARPDSAGVAMQVRDRAMGAGSEIALMPLPPYSVRFNDRPLPRSRDIKQALALVPGDTTLLVFHPLPNEIVIWRY